MPRRLPAGQAPDSVRQKRLGRKKNFFVFLKGFSKERRIQYTGRFAGRNQGGGGDDGKRAERGHGAAAPLAPRLPGGGVQGAGPARCGVPGAHLLPAGHGPDCPLQGLPAPDAQDAGLSPARGGPLPHPHDPHHRGGPDCPDHRQGPAAQRGFDRGGGLRPRPGAHPLRPRRGACPQRADARRLPAQRPVPPGGGRAGEGGRGAQPDLGGAAGHPLPHRSRPGRDPGGADRPPGRQDRLHQPRH